MSVTMCGKSVEKMGIAKETNSFEIMDKA